MGMMDLYLPIASAVAIVVALVLLGIRLGRQFEQLRLDRVNGKIRELDLRERMKQLLLDPGILFPAGLVLLLGVGLLGTFLAGSLPPPPDHRLVAQDSATQDSVAVEPEPEPPPPGRLVLAGLPEGAVVSVDGRVRSGASIVLNQGNRRLLIRANGYEDYTDNVRIRAGQRTDLTVTMQPISQCELLNDSYNADASCFDSQPRPLVATLVPLTAEIQGTPSNATLGIKVNPDGSVAQVQIITPSDYDSFNILAVEFAQAIRYNAAQKDGQPVTAWTRIIFFPRPR
jgi:TonB family protein